MGDQRHIVMCLSVLGVVVGIPWTQGTPRKTANYISPLLYNWLSYATYSHYLNKQQNKRRVSHSKPESVHHRLLSHST